MWLAGVAGVGCTSFSSTDGGGTTDDAGVGETAASGDSSAAADGATCGSDVMTDPNHCGKCAHSCLGGACIAGKCQPVIVGTTTGETIIDVAIDASHVLWLTSNDFWSGPGHVYACPREGCAGAAPLSLTSTPVQTGNLAGNGTQAFFSIVFGTPGLRAITPAGTPQPIAGPRVGAVRLQAQGSSLYYATLYEAPSSPGRFAAHVYRWDGAIETSLLHFDSAHNLAEMVVVGGRAFLSAIDVDLLTSCAVDGSECIDSPPFVTTQGGYRSLTTDGTSIIWSDRTNVMSCPADAPTCTMPTVLLGPPLLKAPPVSLTYAHGTLLVATATDIYECTLPDCLSSAHPLVHESRLFERNEDLFGHTLAADDSAIYWSAVDGSETSDGGAVDASGLTHRVMKLAR